MKENSHVYENISGQSNLATDHTQCSGRLYTHDWANETNGRAAVPALTVYFRCSRKKEFVLC